MNIYKSEQLYIESRTSVRAKIQAISEIQDALLTTALRAVGKGEISQYTLNSGQTIITTTYRNPDQIQQAYEGFERIKQMLIQKLNGRVFRLVDGKNFTGNGSNRY
ncbi:MAG: hypothetical protein EBW87_00105 [Burkholderiaceae bacterium]|nr:hypothetical protein [Burkholderiaceae bacterium]